MAQLVGDAFRKMWVVTHDQSTQFFDGNLERAGHRAAEEGDAYTLNSVSCDDLDHDHVARDARLNLAIGKRLICR